MTESRTGNCWICGRQAKAYHWDVNDDSVSVECRVCGNFYVPGDISKSAPGAQELLPYLAAAIRQRRRTERFQVPADWTELARGHANNTISQRVRLLLEHIERRSRVGEAIEEELQLLAPLIDARDWEEVRFLLRHLKELHYVELTESQQPVKERVGDAIGQLAKIRMLVPGWEALSPVAGAGIAGTCFVAMAFHKDLDAAFEQGIVPAVRDDCGFKDVRVDRTQFNGWITDRILADLRASQFVVADYTRQRQNVYLEAGFALGLGRTVIEACHKDDFDNLHFDVRQRNHIKWATPEDLRIQLTDRIVSTVTLPARLVKK